MTSPVEAVWLATFADALAGGWVVSIVLAVLVGVLDRRPARRLTAAALAALSAIGGIATFRAWGRAFDAAESDPLTPAPAWIDVVIDGGTVLASATGLVLLLLLVLAVRRSRRHPDEMAPGHA